jgi:hypothetical protein
LAAVQTVQREPTVVVAVGAGSGAGAALATVLFVGRSDQVRQLATTIGARATSPHTRPLADHEIHPALLLNVANGHEV